MNSYFKLFFLCLLFSLILIGRVLVANEKKDIIHMILKDGVVVIETKPDLAPKHIAQIKKLITEGQYDGVVFHRVIDGFMAQLVMWNLEILVKITLIYLELEPGAQTYLIFLLNFLKPIMEEEHYLWLGRKILIVQTVNFLFVSMIVLFLMVNIQFGGKL